eukprot:s1194_g10.t2
MLGVLGSFGMGFMSKAQLWLRWLWDAIGWGHDLMLIFQHGWLVLGLSSGASVAFCEAGIVHRAERLKSWEERWAVNPHLKNHLAQLVDPKASVAGGMGPRVLVPLCGKTVEARHISASATRCGYTLWRSRTDMVFLSRQGYRVVGVEGVRKAVEEFAEASTPGKSPSQSSPTMHVNFPPEVDAQRFRGHAVLIAAAEQSRREPPPPVILVEGDFLELGEVEAKALVPFEAAFDRGSLVAIEPDDRERYALTHLMASGGRVLLVAVEHDGFGQRKGPPYEAKGSGWLPQG